MAMEFLYPVFLKLRGEPVLIVGGGRVGLRKSTGLLEAGALVTVVSPRFDPGFDGLDVVKVAASYATTRMASHNWRLVFAATDLSEVNQRVVEDARRANIFCCRADDGDLGDFVNAAVIREGGIAVAISTGGGSPVLAGKVRDAVAQHLDPTLVAWSAVLPVWREHVKSQLAGERRAAMLKRIVGHEMEGILRTYGRDRAEQMMEQWIEEARSAPEPQSDGPSEPPNV